MVLLIDTIDHLCDKLPINKIPALLCESLKVKKKRKDKSKADLSVFIPEKIREIKNPQTELPRIAKDKKLMASIEAAVKTVPTKHDLYLRDSRRMSFLGSESVHLVVTSPPYWTLKKYRDVEGQLGEITDYEIFLKDLNKVWRQCYNLLVTGGRVV